MTACVPNACVPNAYVPTAYVPTALRLIGGLVAAGVIASVFASGSALADPPGHAAKHWRKRPHIVEYYRPPPVRERVIIYEYGPPPPAYIERYYIERRYIDRTPPNPSITFTFPLRF